MKKILFTLLTIAMFGSMTMAQANKDQRTLTTKIADLLAQMPAKDSVALNTAMKQVAAMGEKGLINIAVMLAPPGKGDNTHAEYVINGFSYYTTQPGREHWRRMSEHALCQALGKVEDKINKAFIISQLQIVAQSDEAVSILKPYLDDQQLCDPAARTLIKINSSAAKNTLLKALSNSQGTCRLSVVKALGDGRFGAAVAAITKLADSKDLMLRKVALNSLANIANPSSASLLANAAEKSGYTFESTNATGSYLLYLNRLAENGNGNQAKKLADLLMKNTKNDNQVHTRIAAMSLLTHTSGKNNMQVLIDAAGDENPEYRAAALRMAEGKINSANTTLWLNKLKQFNPEIQSEIVTMLGNSKAKTALPSVLNSLKSKDSGVRIAAITAAGKIGGENALPALLNLMKNGEPKEVAAIKNTIDVMKGAGVVNKVADAIPSMPANAQAALVAVLGKRAAHEKVNLAFSLVNTQDTSVHNAALSAIKSMASKDDLPRLFSLLNQSSQPQDINSIQDAIIAAAKSITDKSQQAHIVLNEMSKAPENKKSLFFNILAAIGGNESLKAVVYGYDNGNADAKSAALNALAQWSDSTAANAIYKIAYETSNPDYLNLALEGYIHSINTGSYPDAQKLLMLRKAMDIAKTNKQKQTILNEVGKNRTFSALIFAGNYLDDPSLQQEAAHAVMDIALADKNYYGKVVRDLLNKTIAVLKGTDSDYQKEAIRKFLAEMPAGDGFVSLFNGKDLSGWKGLVANPVIRAKMDESTLAKEQQKADDIMRKGWYAKDGILNFSGEGQNICTDKKYGDFEMFIDWKITKDGDAGIYLRGSPQVQIWDTSRRDAGAEVGSGGLYNNQKNPSKPLKLADNAIGDWNNFHIIMKGNRVTVFLNGELVVNNVVLENYWDRNLPIFPTEQIELQAHGTHVAYRDIYIHEIPKVDTFVLNDQEKKEGFNDLFDGTNLDNWTGNTQSYVVENGNIVIHPDRGSGGNLYTKDEYGDFDFRFDFQLTPGANNGVGIRTPLEGDAAYVGMEIQILDNDADVYKNLHEYQYHGSVYGVIPAKRGYLKPVGEWNSEEIIARGPKIKVILNGTVIVDGDITEARKNGTMDHLEHPGLKRNSGHIGFLGHGSVVRFKNIRVKDLSR
jgi:HEAT repeat protein